MAFHRLITPTYFGGLVVGQDYLNTPSDPSVGGSGVPAIMDALKSGGPNDGTYFCAFGEDGRSGAVNRGLKAIAENTDTLDDILRTSIPGIVFADATAVGAVTTVALVGEIWVGENGTANTQANRDKIVRVTDQNNNDLEVNGAKIVAVLIHDGAAANVVGTQASGFRTNASVNFTPSIPTTTTYRVWYGVRNNYANISSTAKGVLFREQLRTINNVAGEVRSLLRQVHSELAVNQAWDAAFDSTIRSLAAAGLNERYRRARLQPAGFVTGDFDVAGSGALIVRDGRAVTIQTSVLTITNVTDFPDNNAAALKIENTGARSASTGVTHVQGGDFGYWHEIEWRAQDSVDAAMRSRTASAGPALLEVIPYDIREDDYDGDNFFTRISQVDASAVLNPDSIVSAAAQATIQCATGQFFSLTTPTRTAIRLGVDLLEVIRANGDTTTVVIDELVSATRVRVRALSGGAMNFGAVAVPGVTLRWLQPVLKLGGSLLTDGAAGHSNLSGVNVLARPIIAIPPSILTVTVANECVGLASFFGSQTGSVTDATAQARRARALEWGSTASPDAGGTVDGVLTARGWLSGDGSIHGTRAIISGVVTVGGTLTVTGDVTLGDDLVVTDDATIGGDLGIVGTATVGGLLTANDAVVTDNLSVGNDVAITGFLGVGGDIVCDDLGVGDAATVGRLQILEPTYYVYLHEDFLNVVDDGVAHLYTLHGVWGYSSLVGSPTYASSTGSAKNPGVFLLTLPGGANADSAAVFQGLGSLAFTGIEQVDIIVAVDENVSNTTTRFEIGLAGGLTDDNVLSVLYTTAGGWDFHHRVSGVNGAHNGTSLGAFTDNSFAHFRFLRISGGNVEVYRDGGLILTVTLAQLPPGNCGPRITASKQAGDTGIVRCYTDAFKYRLVPGATRTGPL